MKYLKINEWSTWIEVKVFTDDGQYAHVADNLEELREIVRKERQRHGLDLRIERENMGRYLWVQIMLPTKDEHNQYHGLGKYAACGRASNNTLKGDE